MYLWQKLVAPRWWEANEQALSNEAGKDLAIIEQPGRNRLTIEVACSTRRGADALVRRFGGRFEKLPRNWLERFTRMQKTRPLRFGGGELLIPAGAAFGTGEHATTAMSLCLLERVFVWGAHAPSRPRDCDWVEHCAPAIENFENSVRRGRRTQHASRVRSPELLVDLGTGSGILALAARLLGAECVIGIDNDPIAISTAKENARLNKIDRAHFRIADVRSWKFPAKIDVVTANLFSELLIEILPKLKRARWLILSGVLRAQEPELVRALQQHGVQLVKVRRRGKWIALLATTN
jgi:ribosomal protein L11 methyltransferase